MMWQEVVSWLNRPEITAAANVAAIVGLAWIVVLIVAFLLERLRGRKAVPQVPTPMLAQTPVAPRTWWEYLTNDLKLSPKARKACAGLYNIGWEQLNRPTNNRAEALEDAEAHLRSMYESLTREEMALAEELGIALASSSEGGSNGIEERLGQLSPEGQGYARLRATIRRTEQDKAMDLALGIPLTDYRDVKKALKDGTPPAHILDELPLAWRMIRTINDPRPQNKALRQAVRPTEIRLTVRTESGVKKDDRAELDEDWVSSDKLDMFLPFTGIVPVYQQAEEGKPPILKDHRMVYTGYDPPGTESKLWTRGGYVDRMLERASKGEHPAQLKREAHRKRVRSAFLYSSLVFLVASIAFRIVVELS